jgi:predicted DNA-binding transcriptional regulator YafY
MNRIDRISAILIQLQSQKVVKGQAIADRFSISLRTAYRDIRTLEEAGVPIVSEAGVGYSLLEGYRLPPVMFTREEALAFLTAEKLVQKFTDASTYQTYSSALFKIKAVLRSDEKTHLEEMYDSIEVLGNRYMPTEVQSSDHIQIILKSISDKQVLNIDYFANHSQEKTKRSIEPIGIFLAANHWHLIAYCSLRNDYRDFRIDRIHAIRNVSQSFQQQHLSLKAYLEKLTKEQQDLYTVIMSVDKDILKHMGEQKYYNGFVSQRILEEKVEMTFLTFSLEGFARWYMMFGDRAEIVSPPTLKSRIKEIAAIILNKLS